MRDSRSRPGGPHLRGCVVEQHRLSRPLPAVRASARLARMTARVACRAWRVPQAAESAALVASELVAAAVEHAPRGQLTLQVLMTPRRLRIELHDPSGVLPWQLENDEDTDLRLQLVAGTSVRWGADRCGAGTRVFAELPLP